jgi:hypothetical protein
MKTIKYFIILLFSLGIVQENFAQINVHVGVGRPRYYRPPVKIITPYRYPRAVVVARTSYNRHNYYPSTSFRGSSYYNKPVVVNRYYYGGGYHPYPSYYRPFTRPAFGVRINILPRGYYPFSIGSSRYYYNDGLYYQPYQGYYQTISPPLGASVPSLPKGASSVFINNETYYEYNGTYYQRSYNGPGKYEVVGVNGVLQTDMQEEGINNNIAPNTVQPISSLPENFKTVVLDNKVYYVTPAGEYYTKNIDEKGNITYRVEAK